VIAADLVAEPARAGVDQHGHLVVGEPVALRGLLVEDPDEALQLDEVVARAHRPKLAGAALTGALGDGSGIGAGKAAARLRPLDIVRGRADRSRSLAQHGLELMLAAR